MSLKKTFEEMKGQEQARLDEELEMINRLGLTKEQKNALFHAAGEAMVKMDASKFVEIMQACCPDLVVNGGTPEAQAATVSESATIEQMKSIVEAMVEATEDEEEKQGLAEMVIALTEKADTDSDEDDEDGDDEDADDEDDKKSIEEALKAIFGADLLTEETQDKVATLFQAAINDQVAKKTATIESRLEEETTAQIEQLVDTLDAYLEEAVDSFISSNAIAIETGIRVEMMESFMGGVKSLVEQHNFAIETEQVDIVQELTTKVEILEAKLDESLNDKVALKREIESGHIAAAIADAGKHLTVTQQDKLAQLAEDLEFTTKDKYAAKLKVIVEQYFPATAEKPSDVVEGVLTEEVEVEPAKGNIYADAITRTLKK